MADSVRLPFARWTNAGVQFAGAVELEAATGAPPTLDRLVPGGVWEIEIGFGKGRFLLRRAAEDRGRRFLGIEVAGKYFRLAAQRAERRGLGNLLLIRGEALYVLAALLPRGFATAAHVYFPDPWPKSRHQKRRLFDHDTVDLVLGLLVPGGSLFFATDVTAYGETVATLLDAHPAVDLTRRRDPWPDGARTNYEAKYVEEGRPIVRLEARLVGDELLDPHGRKGVLSAHARPVEKEEPPSR